VNGSLPVTSWSTAGVHVSNILRKLGATRRVDAAGIAPKMGLYRCTDAGAVGGGANLTGRVFSWLTNVEATQVGSPASSMPG